VGMFKIYIDRVEGLLVALHYTSSDMVRPKNVFKGKTAESVHTKIVTFGLVTQLGHAAYLGIELAKAEIALQTGKEYIQDKELFLKNKIKNF